MDGSTSSLWVCLYVESSTDFSIHINVIKFENRSCMLILPLIKQILHDMQELTFISHILHNGNGACMRFSWPYAVIYCAKIVTSDLKYGPTLSWQI
jgi:hypothetical protein